MSYRQKQAAVTLVVLCVLGLILFVRLGQANPQTMDAAFPILVQSGLAMIAIITAANLAIRLQGRMRGETASDDERDTLIDLLARRNGYWFAVMGLSLIVIQALRGISVVGLAETALAAFLVAEVVAYATRLYHYRRGL
jgi:hypothetical protein